MVRSPPNQNDLRTQAASGTVSQRRSFPAEPKLTPAKYWQTSPLILSISGCGLQGHCCNAQSSVARALKRLQTRCQQIVILCPNKTLFPNAGRWTVGHSAVTSGLDKHCSRLTLTVLKSRLAGIKLVPRNLLRPRPTKFKQQLQRCESPACFNAELTISKARAVSSAKKWKNIAHGEREGRRREQTQKGSSRQMSTQTPSPLTMMSSTKIKRKQGRDRTGSGKGHICKEKQSKLGKPQSRLEKMG